MAKTHGKSGTRLYSIWRNMKRRCNDKKEHRYGGRGISVCDAWLKFIPFYEWAMSNGYTDNLTLERKDNNGDYEPDNCIWATNKIQSRNKSTSVFLELNGVVMNKMDWCKKLGIDNKTMDFRLKNWSLEKALSTPLTKEKIFEYKGVSLSINSWAEHLKIPKTTFRERVRRLGIKKAIETNYVGKVKVVEYKGESLTMTEWAERYNINRHTLSSRVNNMNWDFERALTEKIQSKKQRQHEV